MESSLWLICLQSETETGFILNSKPVSTNRLRPAYDSYIECVVGLHYYIILVLTIYIIRSKIVVFRKQLNNCIFFAFVANKKRRTRYK